jgi:hypothetical protein
MVAISPKSKEENHGAKWWKNKRAERKELVEK